ALSLFLYYRIRALRVLIQRRSLLVSYFSGQDATTPKPYPSFPTRRSSDLLTTLEMQGKQLVATINPSLTVVEGWTFEDTEVFKRSEEHTSELQSQSNLVCRLLLEKKNEHKSRARQRCSDIQPYTRVLTHLT